MTSRLLILVCVLCALVAASDLAVRVHAQSAYVQVDKLRFRLVGDEPIASPDGRSTLAGWKVVVMRDTKSDQCYVTFITGSSMATTGPSVCP